MKQKMRGIPTSEEDGEEEGDAECVWGGSGINRPEVRVQGLVSPWAGLFTTEMCLWP